MTGPLNVQVNMWREIGAGGYLGGKTKRKKGYLKADESIKKK